MRNLFNFLKIGGYYILLFFLPNSIIFLFNIAGYGIELYYIPYFVLEFSILILFLTLYPNKKLTIITLFIFSLIIILILIGRLFLFGHPLVLLKNVAFVSFIPFKLYHAFLIIYTLGIPYISLSIMEKGLNLVDTKRKVIIGSFTIILITLVDFSNSSVFTKNGFFKLFNFNIQGCYTSEYISSKNYSIERKKQFNSNAYETIRKDTSNKIFLIILESFPYYNNSKNEVLHKLISENLSQEYEVIYDSIPFYGHTTTAEINELINENEEFYNYIDSAKNYISALPNIKKKQGYKTYAAHSFYISMFRRDLWWKNLGFEYTYGKENISHLKKDISTENSFQGLKDEFTFDHLVKLSKLNKGKGFYYMLSVNTHFPFTIMNKDNELNKYNSLVKELPTKNLKMSFIKFHQQLDYITKTIAKENIDLVIIRGDHKPPFLNEEEAQMINFRQVPEIIIRRKH
jgi:hypothetical protein